MAQRRFGPTRGAGVAIIEKEGEKSIEAAALGMAGYAGVLEKGPTDELIVALGKKAFNKQCGSYYGDSLLPDACEDYYKLANGAGGLLLKRVTDGNELPSESLLWTRGPIGAGVPNVPAVMGKLKAKNGGRWGGKAMDMWAEVDDAPTPTSLVLVSPALDPGGGGYSVKTDQLKGAYLELDGIANLTLDIVGNDESVDELVTIYLAGNVNIQDIIAAGSPTGVAYIRLENEGKQLSYVIKDGEEKPDDEFAIEVYADGAFVKKYPNLHTDPDHPRYWVDIINNDGANDEIEAEDLWTGLHDPSIRPANWVWGLNTLTETVLTAEINDVTVSSPTGGDPGVNLGTTTDDMKPCKITITMTSPTAGDVDILMDGQDYVGIGSVTLGTLFDTATGAGGAPLSKIWPPFTVSAGSTPLVAADTIVIDYFPMRPDALIGGNLYPDKITNKNTYFRIIGNTHNQIEVAAGSDMTDGAVTGIFLVEYNQEMRIGRDGIADLTDAHYTAAWDTSTSLFNRIVNKNFGVVKFATPGITSTAIQKAGVAYADAKNHQYRYEFPDSIATEIQAQEYINDTLGRNDFAVGAFPTYGYVVDPFDTGDGKRKLVSNVGMIHGREARIAADYDGYHKAQAGEDATLPALLDIVTGDAVLNEEILNPVGIQVIKKVKGNFIIWGDRTLSIDPTWKWKHQREQISYYEHVLQENFGWIVFSINDSISDMMALSAMRSFFIPEWTKRALRGNTFEEAAILKIDEENNTDATRAAGDKNAEVSLRLADTTERFVITIGKQGIFESVAA